MALKGSKTEQNLKDAFSGESQANRRYLYFAAKADVEGYNDIAALFRSTAEGETGHAHGHLEYLEQCGDPATGLPIGSTEDNLKAAVAGSAPMSNAGALTNFTKPPLVNSGKRALSWSYSQLVKVTVVKIATNARENILFIFFIIKVFN